MKKQLLQLGVGDGLLDVVQAIADFINVPRRCAQYLCERKLIPVGKIGKKFVGSKRRIEDHLDRVTGGEAV